MSYETRKQALLHESISNPSYSGLSKLICFGHPEDIIRTGNIPHEGQRVQVAGSFLQRTVRNLNRHVRECMAKLVFNLDGVGISDWQDRKTRKTITSAT